MSEYKGRGTKVGPVGKGYVVAGHTGIQLELCDNSKVLVGTQRPEEVAEILRGLNKLR